MHGLTQDGMEAIEDALDCIALLTYYSKNGSISQSMWNLFPQLLYVICGDDNDPEGGFAFEYLAQIAVSVQNFIAKDPVTFLSGTPEGQSMTYIQMAFNFIKRVLDINSNSKHLLDGIVAMKVLITMIENLQGKIDQAMPHIVKIKVDSLIESTERKCPKNYLSMLLQGISMCFWYN